jgi:RNA polymerase sigma-70 factor (ECF subfamily)
MVTGILRRLAPAPPAHAVPATESLRIEQVYAAHFQYVWRCLRGLGVSEDALEDAAHDVFIVVQRKLSSFDGTQALLTTWLYEIALRVARRYRAQMAKDVSRRVSIAPARLGDAEDPPLEAPSSFDAPCELEQAERVALARRALNALDADKREAFVLGCVEQRSAPEIAELTGVPLNTVYSRIRAARRLFAAEIARLEAIRARRAR